MRLSRPGGPSRRTDLRMLLLRGVDEEPTTTAWRALFNELGVPFDELSAADPPVTRAQLEYADDPTRGRYQGVVVTTDSSCFWGRLGELQAYRDRFGVRQVLGYEYPREESGLGAPVGRAIEADGDVATLTPQGRAAFSYLAGEVPLAAGSYCYRSRPVSAAFAPLLVDADGHPLVGCHERDGRQDMVVTVNYGPAMVHWQLLAAGLLAWVTRGAHWGRRRHYLTCQVDDVLLANWSVPPGEPAAPGASLPTVRMSAADVAAVLAWQQREGFTLDLAFNGAGAQLGGDDLTNALLASRASFRWVNHTWSHLDLGRADDGSDWLEVPQLVGEIRDNIEWAGSVGIELDPTSLVTGAHSGLDNPHLPAALAGCGVTTVAADASRSPEQATIGAAITAPRHPTNVYTHVTRWPDQIAAYNKVLAGVGRAPVERGEDFVAAEGQALLRQVLANDPRPIFAHQSNLTRDRVLLAVLGEVLARYRGLFAPNAPLSSPGLSEVGRELQRRRRFRQAVQAGHIRGSSGVGGVQVESDVDVEVPLTVPAGSRVRAALRGRPFGEQYAGSRSGWHALRAGRPFELVVPVVAGGPA